MNIPEHYGGTAFPESEPASAKEGIHKSDGESRGGILSSLPFLKKLMPEGSSFALPRLGQEELLIIAIAAFLFFSKDGDRECALMLLAILFIS